MVRHLPAFPPLFLHNPTPKSKFDNLKRTVKIL